MKLGFIVGALTALFLSNIASAAETTMLASGTTKEAMIELISRFEKSSGHTVATTWAGSANIKRRIATGEVYDLVVVGGPVIDAFIQQGKIVPGSRVDVMKSGIGAAARAGAPKPDIGSSEALKKTLPGVRPCGWTG